MLNGLGPAIITIGGIIAGLVTIVKNAGKLRKLLMPPDQTQLAAELRLLAETRLEMITTLTQQLAEERRDHAQTRLERDYARMSADQSDRRLVHAERKLDDLHTMTD